MIPFVSFGSRLAGAASLLLGKEVRLNFSFFQEICRNRIGNEQNC
jgi:hypothetical protein